MPDIEGRIAALPIWSGPVALAPLVGGISNLSFTATDGAGKYVVRVTRDFPFHHVFRDREVMSARAAHAAGFAPEVVHAELGLMVSRYVEGRVLTVADVQASIPRIARNFTAILRPGADAVAVRTALQKHPGVARVDLKSIAPLHAAPNDTSYSQQWAPPVTGLETAWEVPGRGHIRVAVIDTGVLLTHPEFENRIVFEDGYADFDNGSAPASGNSYDHGTHVAGIVLGSGNASSGNIKGAAPDADLDAVKVLDRDGSAPASRVIAGIDWCIANKSTYNIKILNLSLGTTVKESYKTDPLFNLSVPISVPGVPTDVLEPRQTWKDSAAYDEQARKLAGMFKDNFRSFEADAAPDVRAAGPR